MNFMGIIDTEHNYVVRQLQELENLPFSTSLAHRAEHLKRYRSVINTLGPHALHSPSELILRFYTARDVIRT